MTSENDVPKFLRFCDLQDRGLVQSYAGLRHLQIHESFPLGRLLGPSTRVWTAAPDSYQTADIERGGTMGALRSRVKNPRRQGVSGRVPEQCGHVSERVDRQPLWHARV
jgi:hypothetical protein